MRFNELEITIKGSDDESGTAPTVQGTSTRHLKVVKMQPGQPKKSNQKKWQPPLQQMLDTLKAGISAQPQQINPNDPASKLAFAASAADPAIGVIESEGTPLQQVKICLECGHLVFPSTLIESTQQDQIRSFESKWDKIAARFTGGLPRCSNHCTTE